VDFEKPLVKQQMEVRPQKETVIQLVQPGLRMGEDMYGFEDRLGLVSRDATLFTCGISVQGQNVNFSLRPERPSRPRHHND